jgi:hypothetical protein
LNYLFGGFGPGDNHNPVDATRDGPYPGITCVALEALQVRVNGEHIVASRLEAPIDEVSHGVTTGVM